MLHLVLLELKAEADSLGVNVRPFKSLAKLLLAILVWSRSHP